MASSVIPQGSNLWPLLFLLFVNDLSDYISCEYLLYADDFKIFSPVNHLEDSLSLQSQLVRLVKWCDVNRLSLNIFKCKSETFSLKKSPFIFEYSINCISLIRCTSVCDLGITFDPNLSLSLYIDNVVAGSIRSMGFIICNCISFSHYYKHYLICCSIEAWVLLSYIFSYILSTEEISEIFALEMLWNISWERVTQTSLLDTFGVQSLNYCRILYSLKLLFKLLRGEIDSPILLAQINFNVPRLNLRRNKTFICSSPRNNMLLKSRMFSMLNHFKSLSNYCDINVCTLATLLRIAHEHISATNICLMLCVRYALSHMVSFFL